MVAGQNDYLTCSSEIVSSLFARLRDTLHAQKFPTPTNLWKDPCFLSGWSLNQSGRFVIRVRVYQVLPVMHSLECFIRLKDCVSKFASCPQFSIRILDWAGS